jgi:N-acetylglutamate synthase/N-acetylornithine aminotransferase
VSGTAAQGFTAAGTAAGIKGSGGGPGLAPVADNGPRRAAGVLTADSAVVRSSDPAAECVHENSAYSS